MTASPDLAARRSSAPRWSGRRWRHVALRATAALAGLLPTALAGAGSATAAPTTAPTTPPPVSILTSRPGFGQGDIFITPTGDSSVYANGPEILDSHGNVVWFHAIPQGQTTSDFRV